MHTMQTVVNMEKFGLIASSDEDAVPQAGGRVGSSAVVDSTLAVARALEYCRDLEHPVLVFPKGRYHFWPDRAFEQQLFISNHDQEKLRRAAFPLIWFDSITIDGQGSEFIFHGYITPFIVDHSRHVVLRNFSIDWEQPFLFQGTVVDVGQLSFDVKLDEPYAYEIVNRKLIFEGEGWKQPAKGLIEMDPVTQAPAYGSGDSLNYGHFAKLEVEEAVAGTVRFVGPMKRKPNPGGVIIIQCGKRDAPGIFVKDSEDVQVQAVNVYHAVGMGLIAQKSADIRLNRFNVMRRPGSDRLFSTLADATHFVYCRGTIEMEDCLFENQMDDPSNVHGIYAQVAEKLADHTVLVKLVHFQQVGVEVASPGDVMEFVDNESLAAYDRLTVKAVKRLNSQYTSITFDRPLPGTMKEKDVLENVSWAADFTVRRCTVRGNRARGFLITTRGKVLLEHNTISTPGTGIKISGDANYWFESGAVRDVTIRHNTFVDCNYCYPQWGKAVIDIDPEIKDPARFDVCYHRNIRIEHNTFRTFNPAIVRGHSVDGLTFRGNTIERTETYPATEDELHAVHLTVCENVVMEGNVYVHGPATALIGSERVEL